MPETVHLNSLTPREAVLDALYRALRSYDIYSVELHDSAFTEDASFTLGAQGTFTGLESIRSVLHRAGPLDTTHIASNERVNISEDGKTAHLTATAMHQHARKGEGSNPEGAKYLAGVRYDADLVLDEGGEGLWKFKRWDLEVVWAQGDVRVVMGE